MTWQKSFCEKHDWSVELAFFISFAVEILRTPVMPVKPIRDKLSRRTLTRGPKPVAPRLEQAWKWAFGRLTQLNRHSEKLVQNQNMTNENLKIADRAKAIEISIIPDQFEQIGFL